MKGLYLMKKILTAILAAAMILSCAACDSASQTAATAPETKSEVAAGAETEAATEAETKAETTEAETMKAETMAETLEPEKSEAATSGEAAPGDAIETLVGWMKNGEFSFDFDVKVKDDSSEMTGSGSIAMKGENTSLSIAVEQSGMKVDMRFILKDGKTYMINDAGKTAMVTEGGETAVDVGVGGDYSNVKKVGEGEAEIDGKTLRYEDYDDEGDVIRFYMENDTIYAFQTVDGDTTTTLYIKNASDSVPADAFEIPSDYQVLEY
jgi:hypothetical protein